MILKITLLICGVMQSIKTDNITNKGENNIELHNFLESIESQKSIPQERLPSAKNEYNIGINFTQHLFKEPLKCYSNCKKNNLKLDENNENKLIHNRASPTSLEKIHFHSEINEADLIEILNYLAGTRHKPLNKFGRSLGVQRGKKKKKKQVLMKLMLIATLIKGKIELLLKIFSAHLQVKFFLVALLSLIINVARFWLDFRRGVIPQKVIYYEHSLHQHHYDDHGDWANEDGGAGANGGGYWRRSFNKGAFDSLNSPLDSRYDELYPHEMAYKKQMLS